MRKLYNIKKTVESEISKEYSGMMSRILLSRIGIRARFNITNITETTPDNKETEERILKAASEVLKRNITINPFRRAS